MITKLNFSIMTVLALLMFTACGNDSGVGTDPGRPIIDMIKVTPATKSVKPGEQVEISVIARDNNGNDLVYSFEIEPELNLIGKKDNGATAVFQAGSTLSGSLPLSVQVRIEVTNDKGSTSASETITIISFVTFKVVEDGQNDCIVFKATVDDSVVIEQIRATKPNGDLIIFPTTIQADKDSSFIFLDDKVLCILKAESLGDWQLNFVGTRKSNANSFDTVVKSKVKL